MREFLEFNLSMFSDEAGADSTNGGDSGNADPIAGDEKSSGTQTILYGKQSDVPDSTPVAQGDGKQLSPEEVKAKKWADIKAEYKDVYGAEVESAIKNRFKKFNNLEQQVGQLNPILSLLSQKYGEKDPSKLLERLQGEYYETVADQKGWTAEEVKEFYDAKQENERLKATFHEKQDAEIVDQTLKNWNKQADELTKEYPGFDFNHWTQNQDFIELLGSGVSVKQAYELCDMQNILAGVAKKAEKNVTSNIQAKGNRIKENGVTPKAGVTVKPSAKDLTDADLAEIEIRVRRGEKIVF